MQPPPAPQFINPGEITQYEGVYRLMHANEHLPNGQIFLDRGMRLPACQNCVVRYALIEMVPFDIYVSERLNS